MILDIPIPEGSAFFRKRVLLDNVDFWLDFALNQRTDCWYLSIFAGDAGEIPIVQSIKLVPNRPLLRRYRHLAVPAGELWVIDTSHTIGVPGYEQLTATGVQYFDAAEMTALEAAISG
jgi:hypothetical protein